MINKIIFMINLIVNYKILLQLIKLNKNIKNFNNIKNINFYYYILDDKHIKPKLNNSNISEYIDDDVIIISKYTSDEFLNNITLNNFSLDNVKSNNNFLDNNSSFNNDVKSNNKILDNNSSFNNNIIEESIILSELMDNID